MARITKARDMKISLVELPDNYIHQGVKSDERYFSSLWKTSILRSSPKEVWDRILISIFWCWIEPLFQKYTCCNFWGPQNWRNLVSSKVLSQGDFRQKEYLHTKSVEVEYNNFYKVHLNMSQFILYSTIINKVQWSWHSEGPINLSNLFPDC